MAQEKMRKVKNRRQRDRMRYCSFVSILSTRGANADPNWKMRVPSLKASQLTEELLEVYEEAFYLLDPDDKGIIGKREVGIVLRAIGQEPTEQEIDNLVEEIDRTGSGRLSFNDFLALLAHVCEDDDEPEEEWLHVFKQFDYNKDGYIDENDLRRMMIQLRLKFTDSDVDEMLSEFTSNGKRRINFDQFLSIMT